ncbi:hypothetical protein GQ44DRAFT_723864 [Phaeosphaeriaceae sp. PMI808]|nr:hypothetical protein GQ44DRAFT_723864 [Phaeosphaeriaceae sp. PMI808]
MVRRTDPKDDAWEHVKDAKKRKQIQDRLAQRARRQRLREAKSSTKIETQHSRRCNCASPTTSNSNSPQEELSITPYFDSDPFLSSVLVDLPDFDSTIPSSNNLDSASIDPSCLTLLCPQPSSSQPLTVISALFLNGRILGIACPDCTTVSRSPHPLPSHPPPLHPTETQLTTMHPRWYDQLPFPRMRDSLINMMGVIDEEDLIKDLFMMPSWRIEKGECWDPTGWRMEREWAAKWGWLMV